MILSLFKWFIKPSDKPIFKEHNLYDKIVELEHRIEQLEHERQTDD